MRKFHYFRIEWSLVQAGDFLIPEGMEIRRQRIGGQQVDIRPGSAFEPLGTSRLRVAVVIQHVHNDPHKSGFVDPGGDLQRFIGEGFAVFGFSIVSGAVPDQFSAFDHCTFGVFVL